MTTRNARDKTWQHLQRKASPPTVEPPSEQENGGQREATVWGWGGSQWWVSNRKYLYNGDTGQRIPIQIHIHTRSFTLCSFIRSFLSRARTHNGIPNLPIQFISLRLCGHKRPIFLHKILFTASLYRISHGVVWCGVVWFATLFVRQFDGR